MIEALFSVVCPLARPVIEIVATAMRISILFTFVAGSLPAIATQEYVWEDANGIHWIDVSPDGGAVLPSSEIPYPGASRSSPFFADEPYRLQVDGRQVTVPLPLGKRRYFDFSGYVPFVNPSTGVSDPAVLQGWDASTGRPANLDSTRISNSGLPGVIEKRSGRTMIRYRAGDGLVGGTCRSQIVSYPVPPRTHVRWEMVVAFGDGTLENQWVFTPPGQSPVLFWELKSSSSGSPALSAIVDTDPNGNGQFLEIRFFQTGGSTRSPSLIGQIGLIPRHTPIAVSIEAFLDERDRHIGGVGQFRAWINGSLVANYFGATLSPGSGLHSWILAQYMYRDTQPASITRAAFWSTARMFVLPEHSYSTHMSGQLSLSSWAVSQDFGMARRNGSLKYWHRS